MKHVKTLYRAIPGVVFAILLTTALAGCMVDGAVFSTADLSISIGDGFAPQVAVGTFAEVDRVTVEVAGLDRFGVYQAPLAAVDLARTGSVWSGVIPDLPIGPVLEFTAVGFIAGVAAFDGIISSAVDEATVVTIPLGFIDDGVPLRFPILQSIQIPAEIVRGTPAAVQFGLSGSPNERLDVSTTVSGGAFVPNIGFVDLPLSGTGAFASSFHAGDSVGTYGQQVRIENEQGNAVITSFDATIVHAVADAQVRTLFAPVVTGITAEPVAGSAGVEVRWSVSYADDGQVISVDWGFTGSAGVGFVDPGADPAVLAPYDVNVSGVISVTLTDDDGLATTVEFDLVPGQFPAVGGTPPPATTPLDLLVLIDGSGSLGATGFEQERQFVSDLIGQLPTDGSTAAGLIRFATNVDLILDLTTLSAATSPVIQNAVANMAYPAGYTNTPGALEMAIDLFAASPNETSQPVILLLTDGNPYGSTGPLDVCVYTAPLQAAGIQTLIVAAGAGINIATIDCLVNDPTAEVFQIASFTDGAAVLGGLLQQLE